MTLISHLKRVALLMVAASLVLGCLAARTEVFCADGLRYINQARTIDQGAWERGVFGSVDHPVYPLAIVAAHHLVGGSQPADWQAAAQLAAVVAGILVVVPTYLVAIELIGPSTAWLACMLIIFNPLDNHVMADTMSESSFFFCWGLALWSTLRFLRTCRIAWVVPVILFSVLAYLTRPEGLIVPVALIATLLLLVFRPSLEFPRGVSGWAVAILVLGPITIAGPFMLQKGAVSTKPSLNRILSLAPRAPAMAVERERPREPDQTRLKTVVLATKAMLRAVLGASTLPILILAPLGIAASRSSAADRRCWLLVLTTAGFSALAMIRLHETCGYCTPRHAMMVGWLAIIAAAAGAVSAARAVGRRFNRGLTPLSTRPSLATALMPACIILYWLPGMTTPIDRSFIGYRQAGEWLATRTKPSEGLIDPKGFSLYYAAKTGYTYANLGAGQNDRSVRWVITHDAHLNGPWDYSKAIRSLVQDRRPTQVFPKTAERGIARVYVYDLAAPLDQTAERPAAAPRAIE